jgi:hypothetical protein
VTKIPKIGKAGLLYDPQVRFNWELKGGVKFSYGFELSVSAHLCFSSFQILTLTKIPSGSKISINLVNPNKSSITGL